MKAALPALALMLLCAGPAQAATRNFGVSGFDRIRVDGPFKVRVRTGVAPFARATGSTRAIDGVAMTVNGSTLTIGTNRSAWGGYPGEAAGPVEVEIGTHELDTAWLNGSGALEIDRVKGLTFDLTAQGAGTVAIGAASLDRLRVTLFGAATATVGGSAMSLNATVRGAGGLDASALAVKDATIGAEGSATVSANVGNSAKVQAQGTAVVTLTGRPACTARAAGSATISGCR